MPDLAPPFAARLRDLMAQRGYGVAELARAAGLSRQRLHAILAGVDPRFSAVLALCQALNVSLATFDHLIPHV